MSGANSFDLSELDASDQKRFNKALKADFVFSRIWNPFEASLTLRYQVATDEHGRLLYNGKRYNRGVWYKFFVADSKYYGPPKVIRQQGRMAVEYYNARNRRPTEVIDLEDGSHKRIRKVCDECQGRLEFDETMVLYCIECGLVAD